MEITGFYMHLNISKWLRIQTSRQKSKTKTMKQREMNETKTMRQKKLEQKKKL